MSTPRIAAIICTHNRDAYLGAAIDSLLSQDCDDYEVLIIDNASTDNTKAVVEARLPHPQITYHYEPNLGLSVARNTGARLAKANILAYLDDDAEASSSWLSALLKGFDKNEKLAIAGGKVTLIWPPNTSPPAWMSAALSGSLGAYDLGDEVVYIQHPGLPPRGLNYALRRSFLDSVGGFDANLGRVGKNLLSNEEFLMTQFALEKGWHVAYLPDALAAHNVSPARMKRSWHLSRSWWQGISECYRERLIGRTGTGQLKRGGERLLRGFYKTVKYLGDPAESFANFAYAYGQIGYLASAIGGMVKPAPTDTP